MSMPKALQWPIHMQEVQEGVQGPVDCLALPETLSAYEHHSVSAFLSNKVDMLYTILLT